MHQVLGMCQTHVCHPDGPPLMSKPVTITDIDLSQNGDYTVRVQLRAENGEVTVLRSEVILGPSTDEQDHAECFEPKEGMKEPSSTPNCSGDGWYRCPECAYYVPDRSFEDLPDTKHEACFLFKDTTEPSWGDECPGDGWYGCDYCIRFKDPEGAAPEMDEEEE